LGEQNPCDFFEVEKIIQKYNLEGKISFKITPGNSAELPHCEAHWQIGEDSVRIIRTYVFQFLPDSKFMEVAWETCRSDRSKEYNSHLVENILSKSEKDCGLYGKHNWGGVSFYADGAINYIRVEFEYRNEEPITEEEHTLRKSLGTEIAEMMAKKLRKNI